MKERINRLAKGIVDTEFPKMLLQPETIDETIRLNSKVKKEIFAGSENGLNIKGLVYSSNMRVRISRDGSAFGGLRNHIIYEVDSSFLSAGDEIRGSFFLVTNCGEKEIPYIFRVDLAASGKILGELKTAEDFLKIAERDMDTALRLLEYQDFVESPFMQDMHIRAIYDGLKGHGSRQNFMEEFLVALKVKRPIRLMIDNKKRTFENPSVRIEDFITVRVDNWGAVYMEMSAEGEFIHLPKKAASQADFKGDALQIPFCILSERLHGGRNFGAVIITTARWKTRIPVEVSVKCGGRDGEKTLFKEEFIKYLELRLDFESGVYEDALILNQMQRELDLLSITYNDPLLALFQAEIYVETGRQDKACLIMDERKEQILALREDERVLYCFYQYLQVRIWNDSEQRESLMRLLQKYCSEEERREGEHFLYFMLIHLNRALFDNPATVFISMEQEFKDGCRSPFLYLECLKLLDKEPTLIRNFAGITLQALYFGARRKCLSKESAHLAAEFVINIKTYKPLYLRLLLLIYKEYSDEEILTAVCSMMIRGDLRGEQYFEWYKKAVKAGITLTRLNEYYLYSLPESYDKSLPKEILLYFSYTSDLDAVSRAKLYCSILKSVQRDSEIFRLYERDMEKFAMEQLFAGRINNYLSIIYKHMIYKDLIDRQIAKTMPSVLRSNKIVCRDASMRYVVVHHEELMTEDAYLLQDGVAYVPLFSERDVILFQNTYGNRYMNIKYEKIPAMQDVDELLEQCFRVYPEYEMLFVNACYEIMDKEKMTKEDAAMLEQADTSMQLHPLFFKKLTSAIVRYYKEQADDNRDGERDDCVTYLLCVDKDILTKREQSGVCETLIKQNYYTEAYDMICRYGIEGVSTKRLLKLCTKMVLQKLFDEDDRLLHLAYHIFSEEKSDSVILDYLCEHYNGTISQMYQILMQGLSEHVETYDLEERILAQMLFTGDTQRMNKVFDLYASRKKTNESIVRAYFTIKSIDYFLLGKTTEDKVFAYLEGAVNNSVEKDKVADIYLLALTRYYSTLPALNEDQKELCQSVMDVLLEAGMLFAYFKALARFILIPGNILDKEIIEYHGKKDVKPYLQLRILPDEEEFHFEDMRLIYKGIYIREKVLFEGEILEYKISEEIGGVQQIVFEDSIVSSVTESGTKENRFSCLNEMGLSLDLKNEDTLREKMESYVEQSAVAVDLFALQ